MQREMVEHVRGILEGGQGCVVMRHQYANNKYSQLCVFDVWKASRMRDKMLFPKLRHDVLMVVWEQCFSQSQWVF